MWGADADTVSSLVVDSMGFLASVDARPGSGCDYTVAYSCRKYTAQTGGSLFALSNLRRTLRKHHVPNPIKIMACE